MTQPAPPAPQDERLPRYPRPWRREANKTVARFLDANGNGIAIADVGSANDEMWSFVVDAILENCKPAPAPQDELDELAMLICGISREHWDARPDRDQYKFGEWEYGKECDIESAKRVLAAGFRKPAPAPGSEDVERLQKQWDAIVGKWGVRNDLYDIFTQVLRIVKGLEAELGRIKGAADVP